MSRLAGAAWRDLRHRPGQAFLSGVSLLVGILAVVAIYTAAAIVRDVFVAEEERTNGRALTTTATALLPGMTLEAERQLADRLHRQLAPAGASYAVTARSAVGVRPRGTPDGSAVTVQAEWCDGDLRRVKRLPLRAGRWLRSAPAVFPPEVVLNERAAELGGAVTGAALRLDSPLARSGLTVTVAGVVADGLDEPVLYGDLPGVLRLAPELVTGRAVTVLAHLPGADPAALGRSVGSAVGHAGAQLADRPRRSDRVDELEHNLRQVQLAFLACALVALLVSALGILNIGLAGVRERSRELLVRRAVGARRTDLVALVLVSSLVVAAGASIAGMLLAGFVVEVVVPELLAEGTVLVAPRFPWQAAGAGTAAAVVTTLLGAAVPAVVASRLDIAGALRT